MTQVLGRLSHPGPGPECAGADECESSSDNPLPTPPRLDQLFQYRNLHRCSTSHLLSAADRKLQNTPLARGASEIAAVAAPQTLKNNSWRVATTMNPVEVKQNETDPRYTPQWLTRVILGKRSREGYSVWSVKKKNSFTPVNQVPPEIFSLTPDYSNDGSMDQNLIVFGQMGRSWRNMFVPLTSLWTWRTSTKLVPISSVQNPPLGTLFRREPR